MGGPGSGRKRGRPKAQPRGARWAETRARILAGGDLCHVCGHPGAGDVDHVVPVAEGDVAGYFDLSNLAPAHGTHSPCPVCRVACNQVKGRRMPGQALTASQRLLAAMNGSVTNGNGVTKPGGRADAGKKLSEAEIRAEMERIGPHWDGCKCRESIAAGGRSSRCW